MRTLFIIGMIITGASVMFSTDLFIELLFVCLFYFVGFWKEIIWGEHISNAEINKMSVKVQYETKTTNYWRLIRKICIKTYLNNSEIRYNENYSDKFLYKAIHKTIWDMEVKRERWYNKLK